jgi:predicted NBD/HSP70 family sugar kinase
MINAMHDALMLIAPIAPQSSQEPAWHGAPSRLVPPRLDPGFLPAFHAHVQYRDRVERSGRGERLVIGLEGVSGALSRYESMVLPEPDSETLRYVERTLKFLLWARGGGRVWLGGPRRVCERVAAVYGEDGERAFDAEQMGVVYGRRFEVHCVEVSEVPEERRGGSALGGHLEGCRIGFDLGASDFKVAAVRDGEVLYSDEFPWDPKRQVDPGYHFDHLQRGLERAAACLPRVDAIGGSSAGVIVGNRFRIASLIRSVPAHRLEEARDLFVRIQKRWGVPLEVANDGDVTALAGALSIEGGARGGLLGIAMGSSEAVGYLDPSGQITGWLNELAFAPVDFQGGATADEWSGDRGVGALYFSQQAVNRLLPAAGIELPAEMGLPERLKEVQRLMAAEDPRASAIYETIGVCFGHALAYYSEFYRFENVLVLGRVTTGAGGEILLGRARQILERDFGQRMGGVRLHVPDEKSRRVGQAIAAASLPVIA